MIIVMKAGADARSPEVSGVIQTAATFPSIETEVREIRGASRSVVEVYLLGLTSAVPTDRFEYLPGVEQVIRISSKYRHIARHSQRREAVGFEYQGIAFYQDSFHLFPGLCAVDTRENVEQVFRALESVGVTTTRAGAYKPRTSPYDFQGHGRDCLPWLFELAGKHGIRIIAMEVTHESQVTEITEALESSGRPTGVMLQIGTRNAQNFELLKRVGSQTEFPVLYKRGMGITLEESLNACEYLASSGNDRIVFCLRGIKTNLGDPHRNLVDFAHVPVLHQLTRLPVCIDPSHAVGRRSADRDGMLDIFHIAAQGIVTGANMVLTDVHPDPARALCDGPQALLLGEIEHFVADCKISREAYERRRELARGARRLP